MESKTKVFGHPFHPMLVMFPVGLLSTAVIFDIIHLVTGNPVLATVSFYMLWSPDYLQSAGCYALAM